MAKTFLHYWKFASRKVLRDNIYSLFNIVGFAMGFTICIISGLYIYREYSIDKVYTDYRNIYRLVDAENNVCAMDYDIAERLRIQYPEIKYISPVYYSFSWDEELRQPQSDEFVTVQNIINTEGDFSIFFPQIL